MNQSTNPPSTTSRKSPLLAALLSAVLCGLGQIYNGRVLRGVILFVLMSIVWAVGGFFGALTFGLGIVPFAVVAGALWIFGVVDAYAGSGSIHRA